MKTLRAMKLLSEPKKVDDDTYAAIVDENVSLTDIKAKAELIRLRYRLNRIQHTRHRMMNIRNIS